MHSSTTGSPGGEPHTGWSGRLVRWAAVLILANVMADTVIGAPLLVLPQMLDHFGTDQAAWLNASAMLAGAMWAPLLGRSADIHGKRRVLVATLLMGGAGALVCLVAPSIWVFLLGRLLQGAAVAAVFLSVALIRQVCAPRVAMTAVGVVTSGSAIVGLVDSFFFEAVVAEFGFKSVFVVSALLAAVAAAGVRTLLPETPVTAGGRIDVAGAVLLGGSLAAVLGYVSLGPEYGWLSLGLLALLACGAAAFTRWVLVESRRPEPVVDIRRLGRPLVLTLLVVVLGAGAYQSLLQLFGLIAQVAPDQGRGYGLGGGSLGLLFAAPAAGVMVGGTLAGWLATRIGPARTLAGGVAIGTVATLGMFGAVARFPAAVLIAALLGFAAGAIVASGFNMATSVAPAGGQGVVSGLVQVMLAIGSVAMNVVGSAVLASTAVVAGGAAVNSAAGVHGYIAIALGAFVAATAVAIALARGGRRAEAAADAALPSG
ncbi:MFS transporter [Nocardiopsis sediminis]|uniref:MFS transporter n=1 Tax=Nocardiopsis sediminis TaxID=1778267 RepID=A0ABV8FI74_9ACTN